MKNNNTHLTPAQWLLVAGGASAVIGTAVFIFDERIGNSVIRYFMDGTRVSDQDLQTLFHEDITHANEMYHD